MSLNPALRPALKAAILADPTLNGFPATADGASAIAALLNAPAVPAFPVWRTDAPVSDILDAISWATFTQTDAVDGTSNQTNRLLAVQTKQMNLQSMLQGRDTVNASKANVRAGLRDAVIGLPTGAAGAALSAGGAGGATVLAALIRSATLGEKILAGVPAQTGPTTATLLQHEGPILYQEVVAAMGW